MKIAVLNVSCGSWYPNGQKRLSETLDKYGYKGEKIFWLNDYPTGSPTHQQIPYAFKIHAFKEAKRRKIDYALWLDSSMYSIRPIDKIFEEISKRSIVLWRDGCLIGNYCSDHVLSILKLEREESFKIPLALGGIVGLDLNSDVSNNLLNEMENHIKLGVFNGPWENKNFEISKDPRVKGHRHDMISLAYLTQYKQKIDLLSQPYLFAYYSSKKTIQGNDTTCILACGM